MYYLGIDLGGTNIAVGIVDDNNQIIARATSKTKLDNAEQVADAMAETVYAALKNANITLDDVPWVGLGSPGTGTLRHRGGWTSLHLRPPWLLGNLCLCHWFD